MSETISSEVHWSTDLERYFKQVGERSQCLGIIHSHAEKMYGGRKTGFELPIIVMGAVTGFLSVGSAQIFNGWSFTPVVLGVASLFVSVLNTTNSYFSFAKRQEGHRIASIQYAKEYRFLQIELSLPRDERMSAHDLLKKVKDDYDRLAEVSPPLPDESIRFFKSTYKDANIAKPEEANGLTAIHIFVGTPNLPIESFTPASVLPPLIPLNPDIRSSNGREAT
jgi:hypothetical protein